MNARPVTSRKGSAPAKRRPAPERLASISSLSADFRGPAAPGLVGVPST